MKPWFEETPELAQEIERDLRENFPTLRLVVAGGKAVVSGTFPIEDESGNTLDRWRVLIELPAGYPYSLPIVRETGGRLVPHLDNHVVPSDGTACVLLPESRYKWFPIGAPFRQFLDGPLRSYFANQSYRAVGGRWTHDEWDHGAVAAVEFYKDLLGTADEIVGWRALIAMGFGLEEGQSCPCGRRRPVESCHSVLLEVRDNLGVSTALRRMFQALQGKLSLSDEKMVTDFLVALRQTVKGHHPCPCGSGSRIRDCHPAFRELNGALPRELQPKARRERRRR